jgi:hypothetical protein
MRPEIQIGNGVAGCVDVGRETLNLLNPLEDWLKAVSKGVPGYEPPFWGMRPLRRNTLPLGC